MDLFENVEESLRRRVMAGQFSPVVESKNKVAAWWDILPGKRKDKVCEYLGLSKSEKKMFGKLSPSTQSELEAYFAKYKGRVEGKKNDSFLQLAEQKKNERIRG